MKMTTGMTIDEKIAVLQAAKEGKTIERKPTAAGLALDDAVNSASFHIFQRVLSTGGASLHDDTLWDRDWHVNNMPAFNFSAYDYRIKPEPPKLLEGWVAYISSIDATFGPYKTEAAALEYNRNADRIVFMREVTP